MSDRRTSKKRRRGQERRRLRERRRQGSERFVVVEIARSDLRVVMLDRSTDDAPDRVETTILPWRRQAASLQGETGLQELTNALKQLAEQHALQGAKLQFVLGGEFCVTKALRGTTEKVRRELQQLEQQSRLYLSLGPGEKVTVSNSQPLDARHQHAVAAVCNQELLETIDEAAGRAGLQIESIEPALVAVSRAVGRLEDAPSDPCLLVHLDQANGDVGVCYQGQLLLDYRPGGCMDLQKLVELVRTHLHRLQRHTARQLGQTMPPLRRVYLCGEQAAVENAFGLFAACEEFEVQMITSAAIQATWELAGGVEDSATVPALGALLNTYLPSSERNAPNFMDHILESTREPMRPILLRSAIPLAAVLLLCLVMLVANFRKQKGVQELQTQIDALATVQDRANELHLKWVASEAKLTQLKQLAKPMQALPAGGMVTHIGHCMPSDVWLKNLEIDDMHSIQLSGASYQEAGVFDFVRWLEQAPGFEDVALRGTRPGHSPSGPTIEFDVELNLSDQNSRVEEVARHD